MNKIYFTADLHFGHSNILKHSPKRPFSDTVDIVAHDEWLLDLWKSTVDKRDTVYILGDLTFLKSENARHLLEKLPGQKFLIEGNHDGWCGRRFASQSSLPWQHVSHGHSNLPRWMAAWQTQGWYRLCLPLASASKAWHSY